MPAVEHDGSANRACSWSPIRWRGPEGTGTGTGGCVYTEARTAPAHVVGSIYATSFWTSIQMDAVVGSRYMARMSHSASSMSRREAIDRMHAILVIYIFYF